MLKQFRYIPRVLKLIWAAAKQWMLAWIVLLILQSLLPIFTVLLTRSTVDGIVALLKGGWTTAQLESLLVMAGLLVVSLVGGNVVSSLSNWVRVGQSEELRDYVSLLIQEQAVRLDLSYYEQQEFYDLIHRVRQQGRDQPLAMLQSMGTLISNLLTMLGLTALLLSYGAWLLPVLVVGALPSLWSVVRFSRQMDRWRVESTPRERRANYYDFLLTDRFPAAEVRLFDLGGYHRSLYAKLRTELRTERLKLWRDKVFLDLGASLVGLAAVAIVVLWMGWRVLMGTASLGDLTALYQIFSQVQSSLGGIVGQSGNLYQSLLFIADLFDFLDLEPRLVDQADGVVKPLEHEIRFEHVTFRYPGSERDALKDFSMNIPAGKITALVGANGEGKTTLMKLLCRFYDVAEGRILWDGTDIRTLSIAGLQKQITMLFQLPYFYPEIGVLQHRRRRSGEQSLGRRCQAGGAVLSGGRSDYEAPAAVRHRAGEMVRWGRTERRAVAADRARARVRPSGEPDHPRRADQRDGRMGRNGLAEAGARNCPQSDDDHDYAPLHHRDAGRQHLRSARSGGG